MVLDSDAQYVRILLSYSGSIQLAEWFIAVGRVELPALWLLDQRPQGNGVVCS